MDIIGPEIETKLSLSALCALRLGRDTNESNQISKNTYYLFDEMDFLSLSAPDPAHVPFSFLSLRSVRTFRIQFLFKTFGIFGNEKSFTKTLFVKRKLFS